MLEKIRGDAFRGSVISYAEITIDELQEDGDPKEKGISQDELAQLAGLDRVHLYRLERAANRA